MALRMNLYGCKLAAITGAIGSKSNALLESASARVVETLNEESARAKAVAWLETLLQSGYPLRSVRPQPSIPDDGGLLVSHLETEIHVVALHCLIQAVRSDDWLDLSSQSSQWHHSAVTALSNDLVACRFTKSSDCPMGLFRGMESLSRGTPLFGDDFRTDRSFYSLSPTNDLLEIIGALQAALDFERAIPDYVPAHVRQNMVVRLCDNARAFVTELSSWFHEIADSSQDAYILWW